MKACYVGGAMSVTFDEGKAYSSFALADKRVGSSILKTMASGYEG
jgi:hypothetical protein